MPDFPHEIGHVWNWFVELLSGVSPGYGPAQPTWGDVTAWSALTGNAPEPWEARCMVQLGALRAGILSEEIEREAKRGARHQG